MKKYIFKTFNNAEYFMIPIKAFVTGLIGVSLCMANISGIVTDTGTTPISGVTVQLEKGGQTATTGADGRFTLVVSTDIYPGNGKLLPNGLSARISGDLITVTIAKHAAIEVTTFDLNGKALSTVRKTLDAGSHSITLRQRGVGLHLYKVKSGNSELMLKCNSVNRAASGSSVYSLDSSSNRLAKQAVSTAAINDVITATKTGYLNYHVVAYNSDTSGVQIKMIASAGTVSDTDGNVYQTVRIGNQVWMAENLRVTRYNDGSAILKITSSAVWDSCYYTETGAYCYYDNTTNSDRIEKFGALYNWYAVNTGKLAPAGWHVPDTAEWNTLENYLIANGYNYDGTTTGNKIAKSMSARTDWSGSTDEGAIGNNLTQNNRSGFSALPGGVLSCGGFNFIRRGILGNWWSATEGLGHVFCSDCPYGRSLYYDYEYLCVFFLSKCNGFSVRLVRD